MKKHNNIQENNQSFLDKIEKKNSFSVPNNYFKVLPEVINNKVLENKRIENSFDILSWRILTPSLSILVVFFILFNYYSSTEENTLNNDELSELLIEENYTEIDDYLVYEAYTNKLEEEQKEDVFDETNEYIDYSIDNDININEIIEEL